jgi:hypothetical protein
MNNYKAIVRTYISRTRSRAKAELDWFRQKPTLNSALEFAALAINSDGKRYSHQRRLKKRDLENAKSILIDNSSKIELCKNFDELFLLFESLLNSITGIGELYIYDTALRIGAKLDILPDKVYLHAGTREGAQALNCKAKMRCLNVSDLPLEFHLLAPHEIEDVLCIFKSDLKRKSVNISEEEILKKSWCY